MYDPVRLECGRQETSILVTKCIMIGKSQNFIPVIIIPGYYLICIFRSIGMAGVAMKICLILRIFEKGRVGAN
jgi:hypothetical protein